MNDYNPRPEVMEWLEDKLGEAGTKDKIICKFLSGKEYTSAQLISEIRKGTAFGRREYANVEKLYEMAKEKESQQV